MNSRQLHNEGLELVIRGEPIDIRTTVDVKKVRLLTPERARRLLAITTSSTLVITDVADREALSLLRAESRSYYVERTKELYLAPEVDGPRTWIPPMRAAQTARNPFATRASRISRLLLLHPEKAFTMQELSRLAGVHKSLTSRTVKVLASEGYVTETTGTEDERFRYVRLASPRRLLAEWSAMRRQRRAQPWRLDIGTRTVSDTLRVIADSARPGLPYAISGLAGAQFIRRAVEPADVLLLTSNEGVERWTELLLARSTQQNEGLLRIAAADDAFLFELAEEKENLVIADPVQLWLDTALGGERAREASEAIAKEMHW